MRIRRITQVFFRIFRKLLRYKVCRALARNMVEDRINCRVATVEDAAGLCQLYEYKGSVEQEEDALDRVVDQIKRLGDQGYYLVSSIGEKIVGTLVIKTYPHNQELYPDWWIFGVLVHAYYRGLGIGEKLVRMALQKAAARGATKVYLLVFKQNRVAVNLYRKIGFRRSSIPKLDAQLEEEALRQGKRRIIMFIQLNSPKT